MRVKEKKKLNIDQTAAERREAADWPVLDRLEESLTKKGMINNLWRLRYTETQ